MYNGVLCIRWIQNDSIQLKICTPRSLRDIILWYLHDSQTAGHMGVKKTTAKALNSSYVWPRMRQYVTDYVQSCDICEEQKNPQRKKRSLMKTYVSGVKFERIAMDIAGPFPKSENGVCVHTCCGGLFYKVY